MRRERHSSEEHYLLRCCKVEGAVLRITKGNIWSKEYDAPAFMRVVPTNIGWKKSGENVMGRGVALAAATRYPDLAAWYGGECQAYAGQTTFLSVYKNLILLPVKRPKYGQPPHLVWQNSADLSLIRESTRLLKGACLEQQIVLPLVGCGNGGLRPEQVLPVLSYYLFSSRFLLILTSDDYSRVAQLLLEQDAFHQVEAVI